MNDFDYDAMQKKRIAAGAFHKKGGSKSKGCKLPFEYLTAAQQKKLNGEVRTLELNKARDYSEYKQLSDSDKKLYLEFLIKEYHATGTMIARMLGVSPSKDAIDKKRLGVSVSNPVGQRASKEVLKKWAALYRDSKESPNEHGITKEESKEFDGNKESENGCFNIPAGMFNCSATPAELYQMLLLLCGEERREFRVSFGEVGN